MRLRIQFAAVAAALVLAACGTGAPSAVGPSASAAPSLVPVPTPTLGAQTGSIVFMREDASGHFQTWTACPDLTHARQITSDPIRSSGWPVWSPDGRRIAFNANHEDPDVEDAAEVWDIYTMDADGGMRTKLTDAIGLLGDPGYSPDGRLIAFDSDEPGREGIYTMNAADGSDVRLVTALPSDATFDYQPRFSPDGTSILFVRESGPQRRVPVPRRYRRFGSPSDHRLVGPTGTFRLVARRHADRLRGGSRPGARRRVDHRIRRVRSQESHLAGARSRQVGRVLGPGLVPRREPDPPRPRPALRRRQFNRRLGDDPPGRHRPALRRRWVGRGAQGRLECR